MFFGLAEKSPKLPSSSKSEKNRVWVWNRLRRWKIDRPSRSKSLRVQSIDGWSTTVVNLMESVEEFLVQLIELLTKRLITVFTYLLFATFNFFCMSCYVNTRTYRLWIVSATAEFLLLMIVMILMMMILCSDNDDIDILVLEPIVMRWTRNWKLYSRTAAWLRLVCQCIVVYKSTKSRHIILQSTVHHKRQ